MMKLHELKGLTARIILACVLLGLFGAMTGCMINTNPDTNKSTTYSLDSINPR